MVLILHHEGGVILSAPVYIIPGECLVIPLTDVDLKFDLPGRAAPKQMRKATPAQNKLAQLTGCWGAKRFQSARFDLPELFGPMSTFSLPGFRSTALNDVKPAILSGSTYMPLLHAIAPVARTRTQTAGR